MVGVWIYIFDFDILTLTLKHMFKEALKELENALEINENHQNSIKFYNLIIKSQIEYEQQQNNTLRNEVLEGRVNIGPSKKREYLDFIFENK